MALASGVARNLDMEDRFLCHSRLRDEKEERHTYNNHSRFDCMALLLKRGANADVKNELGLTAISVVAEWVIKML